LSKPKTDGNQTMKASEDGGYHICDNEPFYDYESSSLEVSAANQLKGGTLSLSRINLSETATQQ
jgi:hypothetical protein